MPSTIETTRQPWNLGRPIGPRCSVPRVSRIMLDGRPVGSNTTIRRVAAPQIERPVIDALRARSGQTASQSSDAELIAASVARVDLTTDTIRLTLRTSETSSEASALPSASLIIPWQRSSARRHREVIRIPDRTAPARPMRIETRATLLSAIARARCWQDEIVTGVIAGPDAIAQREGCSRRQVSSTLSLASLAPDIVEAAIAGRLPHGIALRDLTDLPLAWSEQRSRLGLPFGQSAQP